MIRAKRFFQMKINPHNFQRCQTSEDDGIVLRCTVSGKELAKFRLNAVIFISTEVAAALSYS